MPLDLIEPALTLLTGNYIFPEKAAEMAAEVRARLAAGDYEGLDEAALGERVTALFDEMSGDKHLRLRQTAHPGAEKSSQEDIIAGWEAHLRRNNHGVAEVKRLPGNVGLIVLTNICSPESGAAVIAAAMTLVANTGALIFDNRKNRGGAPEGVQLWHSHLFPDSETHLNDIYSGNTGQTRQFWTLPSVPGPRYLERPVWNLTSAQTFSAGEEFSYNLKNLERATLVGETTRGGAHPTEIFPLSATFEITIPIARAINPITGTNWEGTGVIPDIAVPADEAFDVAYKAALEHVIAGDPHAAILEEAKEALSGLG